MLAYLVFIFLFFEIRTNLEHYAKIRRLPLQAFNFCCASKNVLLSDGNPQMINVDRFNNTSTRKHMAATLGYFELADHIFAFIHFYYVL